MLAMTSRRNTTSHMYGDIGSDILDDDNNLPSRYRRGRRKSITVTRKDSKPSIAPKSPVPAPPRPRPIKRSDSSLSRVSLASEFATIQEDSVCDDFRGENLQQSVSSSMSDSRRGSLSSSVSLSFVDRQRRLSSSSLSNDYSSSYDLPRRVSFTDMRSSSSTTDDYSESKSPSRRLSNDFSPSQSYGAPVPRRVSVVSLQRRDSGNSMDFNARRLSTVSDAVVIRKRSKSKGRGCSAGRHRRASAGDAPSPRRSFPPLASSRSRASNPAYHSYPTPEMDNVVFDDEEDEISQTMADRDDLSYEASLKRASLASIHEMHHAVELLKNQRALDKAERNVSPTLSSHRRRSKARGGRRSSLPTPSDSPRQSVISTSSNRTMEADSRRSSVSASIQDMHQAVALIQEKRLVRKLNAKVQFSVVEDATRPSDRRRLSASSGGRRRGSAGESSVSAVSCNSMSGSSSGSEDSDSNNSSDYSSSSSFSGSSSSDNSSSSSSSSSDSSSDSDSSNSDSEDPSSDNDSVISGDNDDHDNDSHHSGVSLCSSSETDSGNGTLSSSHGSKTDGLPKSPHDIPGPSGVYRQATQYSPKPTPEPLDNKRENYFDFEVDNNQGLEEVNDKSPKPVNSQATSSVCVIL
ncbi:uncharacterized protein [Asterias amurensis]|uniref:uncharacterized protein isoform X2 n=1 Tax=Asterias amurensis TaxID=7602 RepID=UPI003AB5C7E9